MTVPTEVFETRCPVQGVKDLLNGHLNLIDASEQ